MLDLTKHCALCGGKLYYTFPEDMKRTVVLKMTEEELEDYAICTCTSRALKGICGDCNNCKIAEHGCACDGAFDAGCFNCTPAEFERPSCPAENFVRATS